MQRVLFIFILVFFCFIFETTIAQFMGPWFKPNLLLILVVFFNFFRGIRYSFITAFFAGLLRDSFSAKLFGLNIFSYIACAYLVTYLKMSIYQTGRSSSRMVILFIMSVFFVFIQYILNLMVAELPLRDVFLCVFLPEVISTTIVTHYFFERYKRCALRLFA